MLKALIVYCCLFATVTLSYDVNYAGDKVYRIVPRDDDQLNKFLALETFNGKMDFWMKPRSVGLPFDVQVKAEIIGPFESFLKRNHFQYSTHIADVQDHIDRIDRLNEQLVQQHGLGANGSIVGTFASHSDINKWLAQQCVNHSTITKCGTWGTSYENRQMEYIKLMGKASSAKKQAIYIVSGMHAREWLGPATMVWIIDHMLTNYGKDQMVTQLMDMYDWYIEPVVNPDGYEYSRDHERLWRKTRSKTFLGVCPGVDGNRNFDFHWQKAENPCSETYPGKEAFSEKETTNIKNFMMSQNKTQKGLVFFSVHTYSQVWLLPYGYAKNTYPTNYADQVRPKLCINNVDNFKHFSFESPKSVSML